MSSCLSDELFTVCLFCFLIELFSCLPWTVTSLFLFKSKSKKKRHEKENDDLSQFLSSFSAFLYEMVVAMSEQYFNQNEPKSHFKINLYILYTVYQRTQMSLFEGGVGSNSREGQMGE